MSSLEPERDDSQCNPIDALFEEYRMACRRGEPVSIEDYVERYPHLAREIHELFPVMEMMDVAGEEDDTPAPIEQFTEEVLIGRKLGDYTIVRRIGHGGMGIVYEANDGVLGRRVALKVLPRFAEGETNRERFVREARSAARLHHSSIVPVFDFGAYEDTFYYVMQYIEGASLDSVIGALRDQRRNRTDSTLANTSTVDGDRDDATREHSESASSTSAAAQIAASSSTDFFRHAARLGVQVAEALSYAHQHGILHRDIKPSNLLLDHEGNAWVADFGLAKTDTEHQLTATGDLVGTLRYMPPELLHRAADERSDLCSLGLSLYELVALRPAFHEVDRNRLLQQVANESVTSIRSFVPGIPRDLETIIHKAIDREPNGRYDTCQALADDLRRFLNDEPIHARKLSLATRVRRWACKNKAVAGLLSLVATLLVGGIIGSTHFAIRLKQERDQATTELFHSYLNEASSRRTSGTPGQRFQGLAALGHAAELLPEVQVSAATRFRLRNEVIGCLGLFDIKVDSSWSSDGDGVFAFSPDNAYFIEVPRLGTKCHIRRAGSGSVVVGLDTGNASVKRVYFPTDEHVGVVTYSGDAYLFDRATGAALEHWSGIDRMWFASRAHRVALCRSADRVLEVRNTVLSESPGEVVTEIPQQSIYFVAAFSPDDRLLLVANSYSFHIAIYDVQTGRAEYRTRQHRICRAVAWHPDGQRFATSSGEYVNIWRRDSMSPIASLAHNAVVSRILFDQRNKFVATTTWGYATRFWDVTSGNLLMVTSGMLPNSTVNSDQIPFRIGTTLGLWTVSPSAESISIADASRPMIAEAPTTLALHPQGDVAVVGLTSGLRVIDVAGRSEFNILAPTCDVVKFSPRGDYLVSTSRHEVYRWSMRRDSAENALVIGAPALCARLASGETKERAAIDVDPTGRWLCVLRGTKVTIHDVETDDVRSTFTTDPNGHGISSSGGARLIAIGNHHGNRITIHDGTSGAQLHTIETPTHARAVLSGDGSLLAATYSGKLDVYDTRDWRVLYSIDDLDVGWPASVSDDDSLLLVTLLREKAILLLEAKTGRRLAMFPQQVEMYPRTTAPVLSADNQRLVILHRYNGIIAWDVQAVRTALADLQLDWQNPLQSRQLELHRSAADDEQPLRIAAELGEWALPLARGMVEDVQGQYSAQSAMELLSAEIARTPERVEFLLARAELYKHMTRWERAREDVERYFDAVRNDPEVFAYELQATLSSVAQDYQSTSAALHAWIQRSPGNLSARSRYVQLQALLPATLRDDSRAYEAALEAVALDGHDPAALKARAVAQFFADEYDESLKTYAQLAKQQRSDSVSHMIMARCYHHLGRLEECKASWDAAQNVIAKADYVRNDRYALVMAHLDACRAQLGIDRSEDQESAPLQAKRLASTAHSNCGHIWVHRVDEVRADKTTYTWSENHELLWICPRVDSWMRIRIPRDHVRPGHYRLTLSLSRDERNAKIRVRFNGKAILGTIDTYAEQRSNETVDLGPVVVEDQVPVLEVRVVGKAKQAKAHHVGIDWIRFDSIESK